jgi:hypothetical protein
MVLLGRTVDAGRVWDVIAAARHLYQSQEGRVPVYVAGEGGSGVLAAYAALLEPEIAGVLARRPPPTHLDRRAPQILNVLRVADVAEVFGLLAPRPLVLADAPPGLRETVEAVYQVWEAADQLVIE